MSKKQNRCTGCSKPAADVVIRIAGLSLPFHAACYREAQADLRALLAGLDIGSALARPAGRQWEARAQGSPLLSESSPYFVGGYILRAASMTHDAP